MLDCTRINFVDDILSVIVSLHAILDEWELASTPLGRNEFVLLLKECDKGNELWGLVDKLKNIYEWDRETQSLSKIQYDQYLLSDVWKEIRKLVIDSEGGTCVLCGGPAQHVHHRTYERRGREQRQDLTALCDSCHAMFHDKKPRQR